MALVGIDPGHGGKDPGVVGPSGTQEKNVTLGISHELERALRRNEIGTVMTRDTDRFLMLAERSKLLNLRKVDLTVSIHCNSFTSPDADYISTWVYGGEEQSRVCAVLVQREMVFATGWRDGGVKIKNLHMLRETKMPAILCECGFLSNPAQEQWLSKADNQKKLAEAICKGVCDFLGLPYKEEQKMDDVSSWAKEAQLWVIGSGISDGKDPKRPVTREEVWTMLYRLKTKGLIK